MKFCLSWLKNYLEFNSSVEELCQKLTFIGLEVESVEDQGKSLSQFEVAKILETKNHENSNKLKICQVENSKGEILQIICGAKNARANIKVALAPIGSTIPTNQMLIKKAKIAGIESNGMLCSAQELGLGKDGDGIIEIDEKWQLGTKISEIYGKNDVVIEINITPNRGDCLGVYGIARDLAASGFGVLKNPEIKNNKVDFQSDIIIKNNAKNSCKMAAFRIIKDVKNCESPTWLKEKLSAIGQNSISAIVDITNYVMFSLNRPMHAYDALKIKGEIDIRFAKKDEKFISLKNQEYNLDEETLIISDEEKPLGIAGIIGSNNSSCELDTKEILLEAAFFDKITIAKTGRKLNILSDARYRFERGVDYQNCVDGIEMATALILEICGGKASDVKIYADKNLNNSQEIEFDFAKIKKLTGVEVSNDKALDILEKLGFIAKEKSQNKFLVKIPSYRSDVEAENDLVEEVIRIYGYEKIIPQKLEINPTKPTIDIFDKARYSLIANGFVENINWAFCSQKIAADFSEIKNDLIIKNPISEQLDYMRPNLAIGLLSSYQKNYLRGFFDVCFFEIGKVFLDKDENSQKMMIAGLRAGKNKEKNHYNDQRDFDIFDVKKDLFDLVEIFGLKPQSLQIVELEAPKYYHPHRSAKVKLGKNIVGYFGEIHPKIAKKFDLKTNINIFEIFIESLPNKAKSNIKKTLILNDLQPIQRDFAFLINKTQKIGELISTIENCDKNLIKQVDIFDIYLGKNIDENKKSVALRALIQPIDKSLTSEEIDILSKKIIDEVTKKHDAVLRS